jgi:hypothetical protein
MTPITRTCGIGLAALALVTPLLAHSYTIGKLAIGHPWTRETGASQKVGAGYLAITNNGKKADRLISASAAGMKEVQLHSVSMEGGVMRMREVKDGIAVPAGETVTFKPGGYHLMFMELTQPFKKGGKIPVTLRFQNAGSVKVQFAVQPVGSTTALEGDHGKH